ncbi:hypothetical protein [Hespellia stercorisuis]|uniref:Ribosomal-protein-alanine N-acetyltransferase n=1 Tax=Hespellia stercorisuis DSM 15480 TaxID=1121950 RepID=A0A1M6UL26_9FIRM|nr:hypothetical protein [Hespellia stercorisuis]SHK69843.1 hypothetical protein SAMN02745243_03537 [Hespellia stercorisuis DSM 15480]
MRKYSSEQQEKQMVKKIICNRCGKEISAENGIRTEGVFSVDFRWEYPADKDGERHQFDLCESCYDRMTAEFVVPVEME